MRDFRPSSTLAERYQIEEEIGREGFSVVYRAVDWKRDKLTVKAEAEKGPAGRLGAGTPHISDGQFLFLQQMLSHMHDATQDGSHVAIVMNGSPLFTGGAGSGESEIRLSLFTGSFDVL